MRKWLLEEMSCSFKYQVLAQLDLWVLWKETTAYKTELVTQMFVDCP